MSNSSMEIDRSYKPVFPSPSEHVSGRGWTMNLYKYVGRVGKLQKKSLNSRWHPGDRFADQPEWLPPGELAFFHDKVVIAIIIRSINAKRMTNFERMPVIKLLESPRRFQGRLAATRVAGSAWTKFEDAQKHAGESLFVPSTDLVSRWMQGIRTHIFNSKSRDRVEKVWPEHSSEALRDTFAIRFKRMITSLGNRYQLGEEELSPLASNGQFSIYAQHALLDRFHVVPSKSAPFFYMLQRELRAYLEGGGSLEGNWGRVTSNSGVIVIQANKSDPDTSSWALAKVIE